MAMKTAEYIFSSVVPIVSAGNKSYHITVRDVPSRSPADKLARLGPGALSPAELLDVVLNDSMSNRIIREYGESNIFSQTDPTKLAKEADITSSQAAAIIAVGELGRRFFRKEKNGATIIRTAEKAFEYLADMRTLQKEHLRGIYLNTHYQVIADEVISVGTVDANIVHPREVFRPAIAVGAAGIILAHNHPSGVLKPSDDDVRMTKQVAEAGKLIGIDLIDHIIVAKTGFASIPLN